ncbi:MAG: CRISPR-associated endonuclease Cas2, partial [Mailhella sp.]|nr:CRISPR-associated endonuclease Cas2 [Mailhella sp.]
MRLLVFFDLPVKRKNERKDAARFRKFLIDDGYTVGAVVCDFDDTRGVNDRKQLAEVRNIMNHRILDRHMRNGVEIVDPNATWIHHAV